MSKIQLLPSDYFFIKPETDDEDLQRFANSHDLFKNSIYNRLTFNGNILDVHIKEPSVYEYYYGIFKSTEEYNVINHPIIIWTKNSLRFPHITDLLRYYNFINQKDLEYARDLVYLFNYGVHRIKES
jgi:hypothetical protein